MAKRKSSKAVLILIVILMLILLAFILILELVQFNDQKQSEVVASIEENETIGVVGDQIFTDVYGGNRMKMFTILTKPINEKDIFITKVKRPFENFILKKYLKETGEKNVY